MRPLSSSFRSPVLETVVSRLIALSFGSWAEVDVPSQPAIVLHGRAPVLDARR
jgi:hypothetical protein